MPDKEKADQEPQSGPLVPSQEVAKPRRAFSKLRRELSEDEISNPAVHRLLLDIQDQLESQVVELTAFEDKFHAADKERAVLQQKVAQHSAMEVMHGLCLALGGVFIGLAPLVWAPAQQPYGYLSAGAGVLLLIGAVVVKLMWK